MSITQEYKDEVFQKHAATQQGGKPWGHTAVRFGGGAHVIALLDKTTPHIRTMLDYGSGEGTLRAHVEHERPGRVVFTEYDPGMPGIDKVPSGTFDLVVTTDVLEHVEPHLLAETIREISDLADITVYHNIPCYPTASNFTSGPYIGKNIHLTVEEPKWWKRIVRDNMRDFTIQRVVTVEEYKKYGIKTRLMITSERTETRSSRVQKQRNK